MGILAPNPGQDPPLRSDTVQRQLERGSIIFAGSGMTLFATDDSELALMEWERPEVSRLAEGLGELIQRHALATSLVERWGDRALVTKRLNYLELTVLAEASGQEVALRWKGPEGTELTEEQVRALPLMDDYRLEMMVDSAVHTLRSLRGHLTLLDLGDVRLRLRYGITPAGQCLMDLINPLEAEFGTTDYDWLTQQLGGAQK